MTTPTDSSIPTPIELVVAAKISAGQRHHQAGELEKAEGFYREVLAARPDDPAANHYLGLLLNELGRPLEGDQFLDRSLQLAPRDAAFHNNRGHVLIRRGEAIAGEAACRHAISLEPKFGRAHYNLAMALKAQDRIEDAIRELKLSTELEPQFPQGFVELARLEFRSGRAAAEVLATLGKALAADPSCAEAHYLRGQVFKSTGRFGEAIEAFARSAKLRRDAITFHELGTALALAGRNEEARAAFWTSVTLKPDYVPAHYAFAQTSWTMGLKGQHLVSYAYAREKLGDVPDLLLSEGSARIYMGDPAEAAACLEYASKVAPERADIAAELGRAYSVLEKHDAALAAYERADGLSGNSGVFHQGFGAALLRAGLPQRAVPLLDEARRKQPNDQLVLGTLTTALRAAGDPRYADLVDVTQYVRTYDISLPLGFADAQAFNRALLEELARLHTRTTEPFDQTLRGGSQTTGHLFRENSRLIGLLRDSLAECVRQYMRDIPDDPSHPTAGRKSAAFEFSGAWSCSLRSGGHHINHVHPEGWISSAYYVQLPGSVADDVTRQGWLTIGRSAFELSASDAADTFIQPVVGRLVLFPSFFWHGTVPFTGETNRVTVAFDVVPR